MEKTLLCFYLRVIKLKSRVVEVASIQKIMQTGLVSERNNQN